MFTGDFNDHIWDEHQWEAHLNKIENKGRLRKFVSHKHSDNIPRWLLLLQENANKMDVVDAFIEEELRIDETYFPGEDDDEVDEDWDDDLDDFLLDEFEEEFFFEEDDYNDGEEWKELSEEFTMSEYGSIETLPVYNKSRQLAVIVLQWAETINPKFLSAEYNEFIGNILKISAKITGAYSFGFDPEFLGANIAYTKKGLYCANDALVILQREIKGSRFLSQRAYLHFHEQLHTLRNDIGIYIQEMREQFYNRF